MTTLSPAAQAVMDAYYCGAPLTGRHRVAAALRAAAIYCTREQRILMTIADELDGVKYGIYRCELEAQ
jgi:hypothetical protein